MTYEQQLTYGLGYPSEVITGVNGFWCRPQVAVKNPSLIVYFHGVVFCLLATLAYMSFSELLLT